jgi:hypothetical protein
LVHTQLVTISSRSWASFELRNITKISILLAYKSTKKPSTTCRRNKLTFYMCLVKISSKLEGINLYFFLTYNKLLYMIIFLSSYRAKLSELGLAQDQLVFHSSYIRRSYSVHFLLSRSRVELQNELISSCSRVSSFSCSPTLEQMENSTVLPIRLVTQFGENFKLWRILYYTRGKMLHEINYRALFDKMLYCHYWRSQHITPTPWNYSTNATHGNTQHIN